MKDFPFNGVTADLEEVKRYRAKQLRERLRKKRMKDKIRDTLIIISCLTGIVGWGFVIADKLIVWMK